MKDLFNDVNDVRVISPHSPAATGTISGQVIDMAGYRGITFKIGRAHV